jgi:hypothetical protein
MASMAHDESPRAPRPLSALIAAYEATEVEDIPDKALALERLKSCEHSWLFPELPGVYVFEGMEGILYVGESSNLRRRLEKHERGYLRRSTGVSCLVIPCRNHKQVECWLIDELKPILNGVSEERRIYFHEKEVLPAPVITDKKIMRLRREGRAKLAHADALEAWGRARRSKRTRIVKTIMIRAGQVG